MNLRNDTFFSVPGLWRIWFCLLVLWLTMSPAVAGANLSQRVSVSSLGSRTLNFESNQGQYSDAAAFVSRGPNYYLALSATEVRVTLQKAPASAMESSSLRISRTPGVVTYRSLVIELSGANKQAIMVGEGEIAGLANYFIGNDPTKWRTGVPTYERIRVSDVYPGINLVHYGNQHHLEYDFEIAPGADPQAIAMRFSGADKVALNETGDLILTLGADEIRQPRPVIYQTVRGLRKEIQGGYVLASPQTVKFRVEHYDRRLPLVIDPVVSYSKYINGFNGVKDDYVWAVAVGSGGDVYLAGETLTTGLATTNAYQTNLAGVLAQHGDVFVTRKTNDVSSPVYFTYLGGIAYEAALGLAVDAEGNAYVTGYTGSTNFPTRNAVQPNIAGRAPVGFITPGVDCFIAKIGPYGSNLVFSTYYGGSWTGYNGVGDDVGYGIALDTNHNVCVAGYTYTTNFPTFNTSFTNAGGLEDGFLVKLDSSGTNVIFAMRLGGTNSDFARDVVFDPAGNPMVTGYTTSTNFPVTTNAFQALLNNTTNASSATDAFFSRVEATSGALIASTFLGGTNNDRGIRLATDATGAAYVTGWTFSPDFPRTSTNFSSPVMTNASAADVFVVKLAPTHTNLDYAITFGGTAKDEAWDVAVDGAGQAHVVGATDSLNFPTNGIFDILSNENIGGADAFMAQINSNGSAFNYTGYTGSDSPDYGYSVALDLGDNAYFVGVTKFGAAPVRPFFVKILTETSLAINSAGTNVQVSWPGYAPEFTLESRTNLVGSNAWNTVSAAREVTNSRVVVTLPATNAPSFFRLRRAPLF